MIAENAKGLVEKISEIDILAIELQKTFTQISIQHMKNGGHIEYLYLTHLLEESLDISRLFQHLFENINTRRFLAISNRMLLEVSLKTEFIIRLKNTGEDNVILSLASKDIASIMSALDEAVDSPEEVPVNEVLTKLNIANKILKTDFDLDKIKPNTPTFPKVKDLCKQSKLCIKNYCGEKLWHYYALWSWSSHSRIGDKFTIERRADEILNSYAECFIEMYLKTLKLLASHSGDVNIATRLNDLMIEIKVPNI